MSETPSPPWPVDQTHVLVPVSLPDPEAPSPWLRSFLNDVRVHVLGGYLVPDQTSPEQARSEFGDQAEEALEGIVQEFRRFGGDVESSLVFTPDFVETVDRVADELDVDAVVRTREVGEIRSLLAVVTRDIDYDRFVKSVAALTSSQVERLEIVQVGGDDENRDEQDLMLDGLCSRLRDRGVPDDVVETRSIATDEPVEAVTRVADDFDIVFVAEREPTLTDRLAGSIAERVFRESDAPVLLVRLAE